MKTLTLLLFLLPAAMFAQTLEGTWINNEGEGKGHKIQRITFNPTNDGCFTGSVFVLAKENEKTLSSDNNRNFTVQCMKDNVYKLIMLDGDHEERFLQLVFENGHYYLRIPNGQGGFKKNKAGHFQQFVRQ
jgi:hypothetical protein